MVVLELHFDSRFVYRSFSSLLQTAAPALRRFTLSAEPLKTTDQAALFFHDTGCDLPARLFRGAHASPNLREVHLCNVGLQEVRPDSALTNVTTLHLTADPKAFRSARRVNLGRLMPALTYLRLNDGAGGYGICLDTDDARRLTLEIGAHAKETQLVNDLLALSHAHLPTLTAHSPGREVLRMLLTAHGVAELEVLPGPDASSATLQMTLPNGRIRTFEGVRRDAMTASGRGADDAPVFSTVQKMTSRNVECLTPSIFGPADCIAQMLPRLDDVEFTLPPASAPHDPFHDAVFSAVLYTARAVVLRAHGPGGYQLTWESCLRAFSAQGAQPQRFPERMSIYGLELERPRWVLENGDPQERMFLTRVKAYDAVTGDFIRPRFSS